MPGEKLRYKAAERIVMVDALRGFALMGLFLVHMVEYFELYWYNPEPSIYNEITFLLFGGKAYAVFALLFGFSFYVILSGQEARGIDFRARFAWRLTLLLLAGFVHGLIYGGDILQILALTGFVLIPFYRAKNSLLIFISVIFLLQIPALIYNLAFVNSAELGNPAHWALFGPVLDAYANGTFTELIKTTVWNSQAAKWAFMLESGRISTILGMSVLGFLLARVNFFSKPGNSLKVVRLTFAVSAILAAISLIASGEISALVNPDGNWITGAIQGSWSNLAFTISLVSGFVLLFQTTAGSKVLSKLAAPGRMSLTVYVFQSFIFVPVFYGFGLGAHAFIGQTYSFWAGIIFWILQVYLCGKWINKFHYGPLEWLWRAGTYLTTSIKFLRK